MASTSHELPAELATEAGRRAWLERELAADRERDADAATESEPAREFDAQQIVARAQGRDGWLLEARRQLDQDRWATAGPVPRSRSERLREAGRRLADELAAEVRGSEAYAHYRATRRMKNGRRLGAPPKPHEPPASPGGEVNLTDPDSRLMKATHSYLQGYNVQAAVNENQIVLAAEVTVEATDFSHLEPMVAATLRELEQAGVSETPTVALADAGFWNERQMDQVTAEHHIEALVPPDSSKRNGPRPGWSGGRYGWMRTVLATERGEQLYRLRKQTVEPTFGHTKHNRGFDRFHRRGRTAVRTEWRLMMLTHNLTKLHTHQTAAITA
jgi:hypothetical protein